MIDKIRTYAAEKHASENKLYDNQPYIVHLDMVAENVRKYHLSDNLLAAAYCHDILEDVTSVKYRILCTDLQRLGVTEKNARKITEIVYNVTNETGRNRNEKMIKTLPKIVTNLDSMFIKLCDRLSNMKYSKQSGSSMLKKYSSEQGLLNSVVKMYNYDRFDYIKNIIIDINLLIDE